MRTIPMIVGAMIVSSLGCSSQGAFEGQLSEPAPSGTSDGSTRDDEQPRAKHENVLFTWESTDLTGESGTIETMLPDGEMLRGTYNEIGSGTVVERVRGFCGNWYASPWYGPGWYWGGAWPYYSCDDGWVTYYTGQVVALLDGDKGTKARCHFRITDGETGMASGGHGECQLSNGDRITASFGPS